MALFGRSRTRAPSPYVGSDQPITPADLGPSPFSKANQGLFGGPLMSGPLTTPMAGAPDMGPGTPIAGADPTMAMRGAPVAPINVMAGLQVPTGPAAPAHPKFFGEGGVGRALVGALGDSLLTASGSHPIYAPAMAERRRIALAQQQQAAEWAHAAAVKADDRAYDANKPQYFSAGDDRVMFDPTTGQSKTIYDAPEKFQTYASTFGDPGTPEYQKAAQDFTLRSAGPTAYGFRSDLEDDRQDNRVALENVRQGNRRDLRSMPTYADLHPRPRAAAPASPGNSRVTLAGTMAPLIAKVASGQALTPAEQQAYSMWHPGRRAGGYSNGQGYTVSPGGGAPRQPGTHDNPAIVTSPEQARMLPKGTFYKDNQGNIRQRQ